MVRSTFVTRTHSLFAALLLALLVPDAAPAEPLQTWYTSRLTQGPSGNLVEYLWAKGPNMRSEAVIAGRPIITLVSGTRYIIIDLLGKTGVSIERSPITRRQDAKRPRPFGNEASVLIAGGAEKVESGVAGGHESSRYRLHDSTGRRDVWVTEGEWQLPVRVYQFYRKTGTEMTIRYLDWSPGVPIPDWFFEPPADVTLEVVAYDEYVERSQKEAVGPAPPFYAELLHGNRE
jgi:hypothetical protein